MLVDLQLFVLKHVFVVLVAFDQQVSCQQGMKDDSNCENITGRADWKLAEDFFVGKVTLLRQLHDFRGDVPKSPTNEQKRILVRQVSG